MSGNKNIHEVANLGLVWGLREIRALLNARPNLEDQVKIVFMKLENIHGTTLTRLINSLVQPIRPDATFQRSDSPSKKLEDIFRDYNIIPEYQNGIFVACGGRGNINPQLQNSSPAFLAAQQIASKVNSDDHTDNYAVYIDSDVRPILLNALPKSAEVEETEIADSLAQLEAKEPAQRDQNERFNLLLASSKKLQNIIGNFAAVDVAPTKTRYLRQIEKLLDSHLISLSRAEESYNELRDERTAEKLVLEQKLELVKANKESLLVEIENREKEHKAELAEKDEKQKQLNIELQKLIRLKSEKEDQNEKEEHENEIAILQDNIEELKNEIDLINSDYTKQEKINQTSIRDLEDEKEKLAIDLAKKTSALKRLEKLNERIIQEASNVQRQLEQNEVTPGKIVQKRIESEMNDSPTLRLNQRPSLNRANSLVKPRTGLNFDDEVLMLQPGVNSPLGYRPQSETRDVSSNTPIQTQTRTNSRPVICKPANFGLNTWNPLTTDIYVHLDKALKAGREALNIGATHTSVTRMILNSLGSNCDHVENFIEGIDRMSLEKFAEAIGKILGKKSSVQMQSFLTAQRRSGEDLLAYFTRLQMLYRSSNKLTESFGWEEDPTHSMSFYSKIYDACYQAQKTELIRKTEEHLEKGNLTLPKLKSILIDVNKIDSCKLSAEEPTIAYVNDNSTYNTEKIAQKKKDWFSEKNEKNEKEQGNDVKRYNKKKIVCWHCNTPGHTKLQCYKYIRKMKEEENQGNSRETKTHGSRKEINSQYQ